MIGALHRLSAQLRRLDERAGFARKGPPAWSPEEDGTLCDAGALLARERRDLLSLSALAVAGLVVNALRFGRPLLLLATLLLIAISLVMLRASSRRHPGPRGWERYPLAPPDVPVGPVPSRRRQTVLLLAVGSALAAVAVVVQQSPFWLYLVLAQVASSSPALMTWGERRWLDLRGQRVLVTTGYRRRTYFRQQPDLRAP